MVTIQEQIKLKLKSPCRATMSCSGFLELKNQRVVLTFMVISAAHSISILSVIGMFLSLWPHNCLL